MGVRKWSTRFCVMTEKNNNNAEQMFKTLDWNTYPLGLKVAVRYEATLTS